MELFFVTVIGACIGVIVRYVLPERSTYGLLLLPAVAAAATAITWVGLLWAANLTFDGTWIWVAALTAAIVAPVAMALWLPGRRATQDEQLFERVASGKA